MKKYSGDGSREFWDRINAVQGIRGELLYSAACTLQELENVFRTAERRLLKELEEAEGEAE